MTCELRLLKYDADMLPVFNVKQAAQSWLASLDAQTDIYENSNPESQKKTDYVIGHIRWTNNILGGSYSIWAGTIMQCLRS